ncbi:MAG: methylmalonyl-CoA mutase [Deltaproteobacteria bacterium]|nr:methylmalonyl-CoA mutase [Deltaproteobacteria bacterium]
MQTKLLNPPSIWKPLRKHFAAWRDLFCNKSPGFGEAHDAGKVVISSAIEIQPCYFPGEDNARATRYLREIGFPGQWPFTRGIHSGMYCSQIWTMRQYAGFGTARQTNQRYRYLLDKGTTGLSVAFDLPTQMGCDSDEERACGEVGRVGVAIDSLRDIELLFDSIPLESISTSMTINSTASILLAMYLALANKRNVSWDRLRGTVQNDILKEYIARGTYIFPPRPALKLVTDIFEFCRAEVPQWNTISISGYHMREAGASAVQELSFTLANAIAYVESALQRGLDIDAFAPRLTFFFGCHNDFLEEVAKFRAARRLWAKVVRERFGAKNSKSCMLRFHTQTCGSTLTAAQPEVNIVRTTLQALAAVLGGTQSLHTNSYDEAHRLPTEDAATLALRTQQVIAFESGVTQTVDPLGGSYCIEQMTDAIESAVTKELDEIDRMGGMLAAIEARYPQKGIEESAFNYQREIEQAERIVVGVNRFVEGVNNAGNSRVLCEAGEFPTVSACAGKRGSFAESDVGIEKAQCEFVREVRRARDNDAVERALGDLESAAREGRNVMPYVISAASCYSTLGEISQTLRRVYGEYE